MKINNLQIIRILSGFLTLIFASLINIFAQNTNPENTAFQINQHNTKLSDELVDLFISPPANAKPRVMWMWMGTSISKEGITRDLETLHEAGFGGTTMFSLTDVNTVFAYDFENSFQKNIVAWTEPWWELVRFAAEESKRLGMDFGMNNCPGYETSGGKWIPVEYSMQQICYSETAAEGGKPISLYIPKPTVDPRAVMLGPVHNPETGKLEKPVIPERNTYFKDIALLAIPDDNKPVSPDQIIDLTDKMNANNTVDCMLPERKWTIYRFGHTTMGALIYPAQWKAAGFECDKMNPDAVSFHLDHIISESKKHLKDLVGNTFSHFHFDSYEAGNANWTPRMKEEFYARRGYDLTPYLLTFADKIFVDSIKTRQFKQDFNATVRDLHADVYFSIIQKKLHEANLIFSSEPYGGPWKEEDVLPKVDRVMTEFWTTNNRYTPYKVKPTIEAARKSGQNLIEAEAFSGQPSMSMWSETPHGLKAIGDEAFCEGINRFVLHRFTQQPYAEKYKPGVSMGQWGTHFDHTQTWWEHGKAMFKYWHRCQAMLLYGKNVDDPNAFKVVTNESNISLKSIQRSHQTIHFFFVANVSREQGNVICSFPYAGNKPELWDPVTTTIRDLPAYTIEDGRIHIPLNFSPSQSFFIVFRTPLSHKSSTLSLKNFPNHKVVKDISRDWSVTFDHRWGGPERPVLFSRLEDWTENTDKRIKYYSGTATYHKLFDCEETLLGKDIFVDLGHVKHIARVRVNGTDLGVVWCDPWMTKIPAEILKRNNNEILIEITNVWANRLIGDEQEPEDMEWGMADFGYGKFRYMKKFPDWFLNNQPRPSKGRYCFTTYNYFTRESPLIPSGLIGPVRLLLIDASTTVPLS